MNQSKRIVIGLVILVLLIGGVLIAETLRRRGRATPELEPGSIPIYVGSDLVAGFTPADQEQLEQVSFVDDEEGKTQEGWMLRDVLLLHLRPGDLCPETPITVSSSSRDKSVKLTWAEVDDADNIVMFDLSGRGTLKLVSDQIERLDTRDEWVQDVDRITVGE